MIFQNLFKAIRLYLINEKITLNYTIIKRYLRLKGFDTKLEGYTQKEKYSLVNTPERKPYATIGILSQNKIKTTKEYMKGV